MVEVRNIPNTSNDTSPWDDSWKDYWERNTKRAFGNCIKMGCNERAEVGAHVERVDKPRDVYIVPLCKGCNNPNNTEPFLANETDMVYLRHEIGSI